MKKIIKQILKEDRQELFINKIILLLKDDFPIFKNMESYGFNLSEDELDYVLSGLFGVPVKKNGDVLYLLDNSSRSGKYWIEWGDGEIERF